MQPCGPPRPAPPRPAVRYISHLYWAYMGLAVNDFR